MRHVRVRMRRILSFGLGPPGDGAILLSMGNNRGRASNRQRGSAGRRNRHRDGRGGAAYSTPWILRELGGAPMWLLLLILALIAGVGVLYAVVR
jgi:hypothetical protein